jgi:hypothetical protein
VPRKATIPKEIIRKYVAEYVAHREMGISTTKVTSNTQGDPPNQSKGRSYSAMDALASEAGTGQRRIYSILKEPGSLTPEFVDKLLCAMDMPYLWREDPELLKYYEAA